MLPGQGVFTGVQRTARLSHSGQQTLPPGAQSWGSRTQPKSPSDSAPSMSWNVFPFLSSNWKRENRQAGSGALLGSVHTYVVSQADNSEAWGYVLTVFGGICCLLPKVKQAADWCRQGGASV